MKSDLLMNQNFPTHGFNGGQINRGHIKSRGNNQGWILTFGW